MVRRIKASGLNILGRTNVPEQGWCIATEPRMYGPTLNPWNTAVTAGGSSGGAVSAVASRMIPMAEASDGGGSIRAPASCCGVVGLKPSRGRITYGPDDVDVWFGSVSTFAVTRSVRDTAALLDATAVVMPGDPYTPPKPAQSWLDGLREPPKPLRIGYALTPPWGAPFAPEVTDAMKQTLSLLQDLGHALEEHAMVTDLETAWRDYNQMNSVQTVLEFEDMAKALGRPIPESELIAFNRAWLGRGRALSARDYAASVAAVRKANQRVQAELAPFDVFLTPTLTQLPRPVGYWDLNEPDFDKYIATWTDAAFLFPFNLSGLPAISCRRPGPRTTFRSACSSWDATAMKPRFFASPRNSSRRGRGSSAAHQSARERRPKRRRRITDAIERSLGGAEHVEALDTDDRDVFGCAVFGLGRGQAAGDRKDVLGAPRLL